MVIFCDMVHDISSICAIRNPKTEVKYMVSRRKSGLTDREEML